MLGERYYSDTIGCKPTQQDVQTNLVSIDSMLYQHFWILQNFNRHYLAQVILLYSRAIETHKSGDACKFCKDRKQRLPIFEEDGLPQ